VKKHEPAIVWEQPSVALCEPTSMRAWTEWKTTDAPALRLVAGDTGIQAIEFLNGRKRSSDCPCDDLHPLLLEAGKQLSAYFAGQFREFDLPLEMHGTDFQLRVWNQLRKIPYGETRSYGDLARALGAPAAVRAVGAANGANPIAIVVPCHRVIGSNGTLTGYGGGLPLKKRLLELERGNAGLLTGAQGLQV
jgi:methylated-DNA-[protein]-cysteine S-methyltransferase